MENQVTEAHLQISRVASDMLAGRTTFLEGTRTLLPFVHAAGLSRDPDCVTFVLIDSETDALPIGKVRALWEPNTLERLRPEIERAELWAKSVGLAACESLAARWNDHGQFRGGHGSSGIAKARTATVKPSNHPSALRVQAVLGPAFKVVEFEDSTKTAADAAAAIGCAVAQIAKSIIFKAAPSNRAVLVIASGTNRVDEKKVSALLGEAIGRADPDFVREATGFAIGGVPPVGHATPPVIFIDEDLRAFDTIWAAAGTPNAVFELTPDSLLVLTGGTAADVAKRS
jgi:prolyl-tRNA editing enzyme YbaK/EbsC (Cys-tRNA(Pro) deacylase)